MPEGPEIRRAADRIGRALTGQVVEEVALAFPALRRFEAVLSGERVQTVEPRGKALLTRFANGLNLYSHNQLYGRWYVMKRGTLPKTGRQLRVALHTEQRSALLYSASDVAVLTDDELETHPLLARLGPDVVAPETRVEDVRARLVDSRFARRRLGSLLLDQGFVCGLGNYLRSEILFVAGLHPSWRPIDLSDDRLDELADAIRTLARRAYRTRGVTNDPDAVRELRADGATRSEYRHFVFARAGARCPSCGEGIEKLDVGGRRLYLCEVCQPEPVSD